MVQKTRGRVTARHTRAATKRSAPVRAATALEGPALDDELDAPLRGSSVHSSRDQEIPSDVLIHDDVDDVGDWQPPALLDAPPPRPGYVQRWVRVRRGGQDDLDNFMARRREGWQPRDPSSVPGYIVAPTAAHGHFGRCIMVEGMVLCEMPAKRNAQRKAYYETRLAQQTTAVEKQLLKVQTPGHPIDRVAQTRVSVGHGKRPVLQEDA